MTKILFAIAATGFLLAATHDAAAQDYGLSDYGATYQYGTTVVTALNPPAIYAPPVYTPAINVPPVGETRFAANAIVAPTYANSGYAPTNGEGSIYTNGYSGGGYGEGGYAGGYGGGYAPVGGRGLGIETAEAYADGRAGHDVKGFPPAPRFNPGGGLRNFNPAGTFVRRPVRGG